MALEEYLVKLDDLNFRQYLNKFVFIQLDESIEELTSSLPDSDQCNGLLTYAYYDRDAGITFEVVCPVDMQSERITLLSNLTDCRMLIRKDRILDSKVLISDAQEERDMFDETIDFIEEFYGVSDEITFTRSFDILDELRHNTFIDDIQVYLLKEGMAEEICWFRIEDLKENCFMGTLLNEPYEDFGVHEGDLLPFVLATDQNNHTACICNLDKIHQYM